MSSASNGNRTEWSPVGSVIIRMITKSYDRAAGVWFVYHEYVYVCMSITSMFMYVFLLPINNFREEKKSQVMRFGLKDWQKRVKLFNAALKLRVVDLNYNFECDWLIELSDDNLASELVENRSLLNRPWPNMRQPRHEGEISPKEIVYNFLNKCRCHHKTVFVRNHPGWLIFSAKKQ